MLEQHTIANHPPALYGRVVGADGRGFLGRRLAFWLALAIFPFACAAQQPITPQQAPVIERSSVSIDVIDPGTKVYGLAENAAWNRLVLLASPKINSGDVDAISDSVRDAATACSLTIMASVGKSGDGAQYVLNNLGVGYSAEGSSGRVIVSSDTASDLGVSLGFIARQVLRTNERQLKDVKLVARSRSAAVFDASSVVHRRGRHRHYVTRHLMTVDPSSGEGTTMTWLLVPPSDETDSMDIIDQAIRVTPWGTRETRNIHVDGDHFNLLGIPGELAFALEDLPPGVDVQWTKRAARLAGQASLTQVSLDALCDAFRDAFREALIQARGGQQ